MKPRILKLHPNTPVTQQPQADSIPVAAFDRLMALCESQAQRIIELEDKQPQAGSVPADQSKWCAYVAGMIGCYLGEADDSAKVKAIAGIIERRLWALAPKQAEAVPLQMFESPRAKTLMKAWQEGWAACRDSEYVGEEAQNDAFNQSSTLNHCIAEDMLTAPQQAEAVPPDVARNAERYRQVRRGQKWSVIDGIGDDLKGDALDSAIDAAIAHQKGQP